MDYLPSSDGDFGKPPRVPHAVSAGHRSRNIPRRYHTRETIFRAGDPTDWVGRVDNGAVALIHLRRNGRRQICGFAFPREIIGFARGQRLIHDAEALSQVAVTWHWRRAGARGHADTRCEDQGDEAANLLLAELMNQAEILCMRSATARVAAFLNSVQHRAPADPGRPAFFALKMRRADIADYVQLAPETVCRGLHILESDGVIERCGAQLFRVCDQFLLETIAEDS